MKRLGFFIVFCFLGLLGSLNAQVSVTIGSGDTQCSSLPIEETFKFSISQQIYTAEEMSATPGTITSVAFKMANNSQVERNVSVYMINTDKNSFTHTQDWVNLSSENLVYSGAVTYPGAAGEWFTIDFQNSFDYTGGNVLLCVYDYTGLFVEYSEDAKFYTYSVGSSPRSLNKQSLQYTYNVTDMSDVYGNYQGSDPYYNNQVKFEMVLDGGDDNPISVSPETINLGERPNGAWMRPVDVEISSNVSSINVNSIQSSNSYFTLSDVNTPVEINYNEPITIGVSHGEGSGLVNAQLTITYNTSETKVVDMTATAYTPVAPDVWEMAEEVTSLSYLGTPAYSSLHANYSLPFDGEDGTDAVYKLVLATDKLLTATTTGTNGKAILYEEDFNGEGGPDVDNYYHLQTSAVISNMLVPAGTYYLVASATSSFMVFIDGQDVPAPAKAFNPSPANEETDVNDKTLEWDFAANTVEYQLLLGTQNPPQNVVVDWTDELQTEYEFEEMSNNNCYYWQVNVRNTSGTANGDVWSFSTPFDAPANVTLANNNIYEGNNLSVSWDAIQSPLCLGYNVYCNGTKVNANIISGTSYSISNLAYNMEGYSITVTAVYDFTESGHSSAVMAYVSGKSELVATIYEIDGVTTIAGGQITLDGNDEFGTERTYTLNFNSNGNVTNDIYVGEYEATITVDGYQTAYAQVSVVYGQTTTLDIMLYETYYPVDFVEATEMTNAVKVEWGMGRDFATDKTEANDVTRSLQSYNVYRRNIHTEDFVSVANEITTTSFVDNEWNDLSAGLYQWGVSAVYGGNRSVQVIMEESFESGSMPQGWTTYEEPESEYYISDWGVKTNVYGYGAYEGSYAAFSQGSPSATSFYMVTSDIDLARYTNAELSFHYITPAWDSDVNTLMVKIASNPTGPWTQLWSSNATNVASWTEAKIDLSDYVEDDIYIAFVAENHYGYCAAVDNIVISNESNESEIVWSNGLDSDMITTVEVAVTTNSSDPATGTIVSFENMFEDYTFETTLDETGSYTWSDFRKGTYELTVSKEGFTSDAVNKVYEIWDATEIECLLTEMLNPVENLYVSPTGWVMWDNDNTRGIVSYDIKLNGIFQEEVTTPYYQHDIEAYAFEEGTVYTTTVIANYTTGSSAAVKRAWTFSECDNFEGATDLTVENVDGNNVLTWTLPEVDYDLETEGDYLFYDDGINIDGVGRYSGGTFYWGIMLTASDLAPYVGQKLLKVSTYDYASHDGTISIYLGGSAAPGTLVHSQSYYCAGSKQYIDFELSKYITIGSENIWIVFHNLNGQYIAPAGVNTGNPNGRWISENGVEWYDMYLDTGYEYTWNIRAFVNHEGEYPNMEKDIIGAMVYRNGELVTSEPVEGNTFTDLTADAADYSIRLVHGGLPNVSYYAMSCMTNIVSIDENNVNEMTVYPNPVRDNLNVVAEDMRHITVTNALGQVVYERDVNSDKEIVNMTQFEDGVYMIRIQTENTVTTKRIMLAH